jgi:hypothetical protein
MLNGSGSNIVAINEEAASADYINTGNDLGIGTFSPTHKLHVNGGILATSSITANGGLYTSLIDNPSGNLTLGGATADTTLVYQSVSPSFQIYADPADGNAFIALTPNGLLSYSSRGGLGAASYSKNGVILVNDSGATAIDISRTTGKITAATSFVMGYERVSNGGTGTTFTATCSAGKKVMGGGCQTDGTILASYPDSDTTFTCTTSASAATTAWAICGRIE